MQIPANRERSKPSRDRETHLLHHVGGSGPFPTGCNFENGLVTRFLSARAEVKIGSSWAQRGWQGDAASLKDLARHAGSLAAKNVTFAADRDFHLNEVIQIPDHVGPFQLPLLARQTLFQFLAQQ